jgi:hypothetical protein
MNKFFRKIFPWLAVLGMVLGTAGWGSFAAHPMFWDGGAFPTETPTPTETATPVPPTDTPEPTSEALLASAEPVFPTETQLAFDPSQQSALIEETGEESQPGLTTGFSPFLWAVLCIAMVFVLGLGVLMLIPRNRMSP